MIFSHSASARTTYRIVAGSTDYATWGSSPTISRPPTISSTVLSTTSRLKQVWPEDQGSGRGPEECSPLITLRKVLIRWHDTGNRVRFTIKLKRAADDTGIATEARSPELISENHLVSVAANVFLGQEITAQKWQHAKRLEKIGCYSEGRKLDRLTGAHQRQVLEARYTGAGLRILYGLRKPVPRSPRPLVETNLYEPASRK